MTNKRSQEFKGSFISFIRLKLRMMLERGKLSKENHDWLANSRTEFLAVISMTLLATLMRLYKLGTWSYWIDEAHTIECAQGTLFTSEPMAYFYPINFLITSVFLKAFGTSEFSARLFAAIMGIAVVPIIYFFVRMIFDRKVALLSALFVVLSPWHLDWSQNARHFSPVFLLVTVSSLSFFLALERNRWKLMIVSLISILLAILTHPSAGFMIPTYLAYVILLHFLPFEKPAGLTKRNILIFFSPFALAFLVALPKFGKLFVYLIEGKTAWNPPSNVFMSIVYYLEVPFICVSLAAALFLLLEKDRRGLFLSLFITVPVILLLIASTITIASGAYALITLLPHAIVASFGCTELMKALKERQKIFGLAIIVLLIMNFAANDFLYYRYQNGNRPRWKEAINFVKERMADDDAVFASAGNIAEIYLNQGKNVRWLERFDPQDIGTNRRTWFLVFKGSGDLLPVKEEVKDFVEKKCKFLKEFDVNTSVKMREIDVYVYQR